MANAPSSLYPFSPSTAAAILFTVLYALLTVYHTYMHTIYPRRHRSNSSTTQTRKCRHNYTIPTAIAAWLSTAGYALRTASINKKSEIGLYASSSSLIVIAPIFVCATLYLLIARLIRRCLPPTTQPTTPTSSSTSGKPTRPDKSRTPSPQTFLQIPPLWLGRLFITSDILSFLTQASGTSIAASGDWSGDSVRTGTNILLLGLSLQLATLTAFLLLLWLFVCRVRAHTLTLAQRDRTHTAIGIGSGFEPRIKSLLLGVLIAAVSVEIRSVYRVAEFALGVNGYPFRNEWMLYVFEAVPMGVAVAAVGWWHPVRLVPEGILPEVEGEREKGEEGC